jgi:hypothetical protein
MRILVRNALSGEFLKADGGWTKDVQESCSFEKSYEAIEVASKLNGSALEILLSFDDPAFDINIPLQTFPPTQSLGGKEGFLP